MPTTTSYFGTALSNFGPLTTTYTAPSSCYTGTDRIVLVHPNTPNVVQAVPTCKAEPIGECLPSGSKWDANETSSTSYQYAYYSPGVVCPAGWTTVGTLAHGTKTGGDVSGAFSNTETAKGSHGTDLPTNMDPLDFWLHVLDKSETLVHCCPSGYNAEGFGDCYSSGSTSSHTYTEQCLQSHSVGDFTIVSTLDGTTLCSPLVSWVLGASTTYKEPLETKADWTSDLIAATWIPAVALVHGGSDVGEAKNGTDAEETGKTEEGEEEDDDSGAPRQAMVSVFAVAMGMLAGAGMLIPW
ncbi:hypothetical protein CEP54_003005 [Fusarium duplospermum]|uniref:Uncharacterized protein n=1 Tax=Fusarium duplospermum TaxID=1325734 RepID=A0A428QRW1_9HYPO|nr:hypothetical protein CEP54_003005 [Fusarium duplospermum]